MIGYYAHHHGQGHLTRLQSIAAHLAEPVWGLSTAPAPPGWAGGWLTLEHDAAPVPDPDVAEVTASGVLHWAPLHHPGLRSRMSAVAGWIEHHRPRLMVVDVSVEIALLARLLGVPTVVVALPGRRLDRPHHLAYDSAAALLAPWPHGTHDVDWPPEWKAKAHCVGGISRFDGRATDRAPARQTDRPVRRVLVLWGSGGTAVSPSDLTAAREATPEWYWTVRSPDSPSPDLWDDLISTDVVVTHGGQNAVAEVAAARRPAVVIAQPRPFNEQQATATALNRFGVAIGLDHWPATHEWPTVLDRAAAQDANAWRQWSTGHGGADAAALLDHLVTSDPADRKRQTR